MEPALDTEIRETFDELIREFSSIPEETINIVPVEGGWTAGQLAEHVLKSTSGLPEMLHEKTEEASRPPDQHVRMIRSVFLDYSTKMEAPEFVVPSAGPHDKATLLDALAQSKSSLAKAALDLDLTGLSKGFEFPNMGYLTRLEWLTFSVVHTKRHLEQLKRIHKTLSLKI